MNKKALAVKALVGIVLLVFLLILALLVIAAGPGGITKWWKTIAPSYNQSVQPADEIQIIAYNLEEDIVENYDGISWVPLSDQLEFRDKTIQSNEIKKNIKDYYFNRKFPVVLELNKKVNKNITVLEEKWKNGRIYNKNFSIIGFDEAFTKNGVLVRTEIFGDLSKPGSTYLDQYFVLTLENKLLENILDEQGVILDFKPFKYLDAPEREIIDKVSAWRDSIFGIPVTISYTERYGRETGNTSNQFCVEKINTRLIVDLSKPEEVCN